MDLVSKKSIIPKKIETEPINYGPKVMDCDILSVVATFVPLKPWICKYTRTATFYRALFRHHVYHLKEGNALLKRASHASWWPRHLLSDEEMSEIACSIHGLLLAHAPAKTERVVSCALQQNGMVISQCPGLNIMITTTHAIHACRSNRHAYAHLPLDLRDHMGVAYETLRSTIRAGRKFCDILEHASPRLRDTEDLVVAVATRYPHEIQHASHRLRDSVHIMTRVISVDPCSIQYGSTAIRCNMELALMAIRLNTMALKGIHPDLRRSREIRQSLRLFCGRRGKRISKKRKAAFFI